jgi:TolA-binding protein
MTDPKRLLLGEGNPEEQELLAAGVAEEPPADGKKRLALALGLSATTLVTAERAEASRGALSKLLGAKLGLKAALVLSAGGALALGLALATRTPSARPARPLAPASASRAPSTQEGQDTPRPNHAPGVALDAERLAPAAPAPAAPPSSIADEVARLDAVRRALSVGDSAGALEALAAYEHSYPRGALSPEAARLRVEAFLVQGDPRRAQALARAFLRAYPHSPHAPALRKIAERPRRAEAHE